MKAFYKLFSVLSGLLSGMIAGMLFKRVWKTLAREEEAPEVTDEDRSWREVLPAAMLKGAVVATVRALVGRGEAVGVRRLTGSWPG